jgi:hypothetical protein
MMANTTVVIPGRAKRELRCAIAHQRIHNHDNEYGFRACASGRQLPTKGASRNDENGLPDFSREKTKKETS